MRILAAFLLLSACAPAAVEDDAAPSAPVSGEAPRQAEPANDAPIRSGELFGQWQLASLSGFERLPGPQISILIGHNNVQAQSQCIVFLFRLPGQPEEPPTAAGAPVIPPPCARPLSPVEARFSAVVNPVRRVERRGERIALIGDEGEAVIERPQSAPTNPQANVPGPGAWLMWGEWRVASIDGRAPSAAHPIQLLFRTVRIEAQSGCVPMLWDFTQDQDTLTVIHVPVRHGVCERMSLPEEEALQRIFGAGTVRITHSTPTERHLASRAGTLVLRR